MRLPRPFFRLPLRVDAERLRAEVDALPSAAWVEHPNRIRGNAAVRLISAGGGENDDVYGPMAATPHLARLPYVRQVLAHFGVVWSRSRLLRLAPGAEVPQHADINHHWFYRVRVHVPVRTRPEVRFTCDGESVHMAAGEAWVFDNWRQHRVVNPTDEERIHLVADTTGTADFWRLVARADAPGLVPAELRFDPAHDASPLTERAVPPPVMPPAEVELLVADLRAELAAADDSPASRRRLAEYHAALNAFTRDWRQCHALHGDDAAGRADYERLSEALREASRTLGEGLAMRTNRVAAHQVLEGRVLRALLSRAHAGDAGAATAARSAVATRTATVRRIPAPVFIVAAPRSGSTLLYETLAASERICSVGGEAHWAIESLPALRPGAPGVDSNRLTAAHATPAAIAHVAAEFLVHARDAAGRPATPSERLRFLEKTPKNVLRIPFLRTAFPDARFVFLWREPRANLASIIEAWRGGGWRTYGGLPGFDGPWSLLLPPGWAAMNGRPLEEIAAFQWDSANRIALDDLAALPRADWTAVRHEDFVADPAAEVRRICAFAELEFDAALAARVAAPLPHSRQTQTPPDPDKWRKHATAVEAMLPRLAETLTRLEHAARTRPAAAQSPNA